ncbi:YigZ family protein [Desulfofalx alkaliphila]|uniref:YigZ family protein n=1 Tax=Desulfofalx alkaliphila TaxID=105483 RepID=UPI0004E1010B|nr:YigZ family protein [Desulfofalx alkaliphila]
MDKQYVMLCKPNRSEIVIKKSRFIASVSPVNNEEEAANFIQQIKEEHKQATHNVFAYVINEQIQRYSDDGEPSGTAGRPVLEVINNKGLVKTAVVVTRYFGGIMLGAGGLVRAYTEAAVLGIEEAGIAVKTLHQQLHITVDYNLFGLVKKIIEQNQGRHVEIAYEQHVKISAYFLSKVAQSITRELIDATAAQVTIEKGKETYI